MKNSKKHNLRQRTCRIILTINLIICILTFLFQLLSWMALTDIYNGKEDDLSTEWSIVRVSFFLTILLCIIFAITYIKLINKYIITAKSGSLKLKN